MTAPKKRKTMQLNKIIGFTGLRHKKDNNEKKREEERSWSDLPTEILEHIMAGIYLSDITSFHAVCKQWRSIKCPPNQQMRHQCRPRNQMPWLMISNRHCRLTSSCTLIDPSSSYKKIHNIKIEGIGPNENTQVCGTKFGWLLLSRTHFDSDCFRTSFFLYSPFINERIDLPDLDSKFDVATFSLEPTSPDCIFFVLSYTDRVKISICRQGDMAWSTSHFSGGFSPIKDVIYSNGMFYCSNIRGGLATFDVARKSWNVLSELKPILDVPSYAYSSFMIGDDNGELLLILISNSDRWASVHKLDRSKMEWIKVESLIDKSLFISSSTSIVVSKNKMTKGVMNRIYYCLHNEPPKFYSFKAEKIYQSFIHYGDLSKEAPKNFFWIEPPC